MRVRTAREWHRAKQAEIENGYSSGLRRIEKASSCRIMELQSERAASAVANARPRAAQLKAQAPDKLWPIWALAPEKGLRDRDVVCQLVAHLHPQKIWPLGP